MESSDTGSPADIVSAIIVAGGKGERFSRSERKQYIRLGARSILGHTLNTYASIEEIDEIVVVAPADDVRYIGELIPAELGQLTLCKPLSVVAGGVRRQDSVLAGLQALDARSRIVLIHDAVRPFVDPSHIKQVIESVIEHGGAVLAVPVKDTLKRCDDGFIVQTAERAGIFAAQTPQAFDTDKIRRAHEIAAENGLTVTDDAALFEELGYDVAIVEGSYLNIKITTQEDLVLARAILAAEEA